MQNDPPDDPAKWLRQLRRRRERLQADLARVQDETGEAVRAATAAGMTAPDIADLVGLSTQRIYQHRTPRSK